MHLNVPTTDLQHHQHTAQQLIDHSAVLKQLFQDQWFYLWSISSKNLWQIDAEQHRLSIADGLLQIQFLTHHAHLIEFSSNNPNVDVQKIADFVFHDIEFFLGHGQPQHTVFLQTKVQLFRQLLVEEVFHWVDGENRIEEYLYNLDEDDAATLDQIMIQGGYYQESHLTAFAQSGISIPLTVELNFKHLSLVNSVLGEHFLPVKTLIPLYEQLCCSADQFIPAPIYRILQTAFKEHFSLAQLLQHQAEFALLEQHAQQQPQLLALSQWISRDYWQYPDIFSKSQFLTAHAPYWDQRISPDFPLFHFKRSVNWLFKQPAPLVDEVAAQLDDLDVRLAVTAFSFIDSSRFDVEVLIQTLRYFKPLMSRLLVRECAHLAQQQQWFGALSHTALHPYRLRGQVCVSTERGTEIASSVLYAQEWLHLLSLMSQQNSAWVKQCFSRMSRLMQAFAVFLQARIEGLPKALIPFMDLERQQQPRFIHLLQAEHMDVTDFRKRFKHQMPQHQQSISVFDSYVRDYLVDYFYQDLPLPKNVTWMGLFHQAVAWHTQLHVQETLERLRQRITVEHWPHISPQDQMFTERWKFVELNSLDQIIHESLNYRHCLALAYSQRIAEGQYVAFHMQNLEDERIHLTLGCNFKFDQLHYDQLRLPNNEAPTREMELDAMEFIHKVNHYLIWDAKAAD